MAASSGALLKGPQGSHTFINDLAPAADGHVYVTDSFRPILFRARFAPGAPMPLDPWLDLNATPIRYVPNQINLNGIVASGDGRMLPRSRWSPASCGASTPPARPSRRCAWTAATCAMATACCCAATTST